MTEECEWKQYNEKHNVWKSSCTTTIYDIAEPERYNFKYCPYCSKKIVIREPPEPRYNPTEDMDVEDRGPEVE